MSLDKGHEEVNFDPNDKKDVKKVKQRIKELISQGYYAYYYDAVNRCYHTLQPKDINNLTDEKLTKFVLAKAKRKVVTNPQTGG